ncbi:MAG: amidohydrolase [Candidatus Hydrogenedentes bacterium]|nr:amidohydrolase [Candidatus Hydrogenedentota bacterium]
MPRLFTIALLLVVAFPAMVLAQLTADSPLRTQIEATVVSDLPSLRELYEHLHANPELSFQEKETSARIANEMESLGYDVTTGVGGHGVVAVLRNGEGPSVMVRADMDALPVQEETGLPYASAVTATDDQGNEVPVMHACGHDIHMTVFVGTAKVLTELRESWRGTLVMIAQPAEERGAGAKAMLDDGLYTRFPRPDYALALHVKNDLETGKINYVKEYACANVDMVDLTIRGIGGHGAYPHQTKDPIVVAAEVIVALQTIVSREQDPIDPAVVTVGSIHAGAKHNIIPEEARLQLTVRTYSDETRERVLASIERIATNVAQAAGVPDDLLPTMDIRDEYTPALYNDPALVDTSVRAIGIMIGEDNVVEGKPTMGGEDFGRYGREEPPVPIFMFGLGTIPSERLADYEASGQLPPSLHSSRFQPEPGPTIATGVKAMTAAVLNLLVP